MKTEEDEAFDDIARRQGAWGGGFQAKRQAAMDKINSDFDEEYKKYRAASPEDYSAPKQEPVAEHPNLKGESMTKDEALTLEALKYAASKGYGRIVREMKIAPFIIKGDETLAQPAQEPVARVTGVYGGRFTYEPINRAAILPIGMALYTAPPQRPWVGLTDEEMYLNCPNWLSQEQCKAWIQQIEAALKDKNT
jgi:hypothetical protein